ncbi:MAG: hypothetical protein GXY54_00580 [Deltaproteobacteria bacterium]|nr:hypothetical protein [Deltaproteobacteria bacterium]
MKKPAAGTVPEICLLLAAGMILLNYPFLGIFGDTARTPGLSPLLVFLFLTWGLLILAIFLFVRNLPGEDDEQDEAGNRQKRRRP